MKNQQICVRDDATSYEITVPKMTDAFSAANINVYLFDPSKDVVFTGQTILMDKCKCH